MWRYREMHGRYGELEISACVLASGDAAQMWRRCTGDRREMWGGMGRCGESEEIRGDLEEKRGDRGEKRGDREEIWGDAEEIEGRWLALWICWKSSLELAPSVPSSECAARIALRLKLGLGVGLGLGFGFGFGFGLVRRADRLRVGVGVKVRVRVRARVGVRVGVRLGVGFGFVRGGGAFIMTSLQVTLPMAACLA